MADPSTPRIESPPRRVDWPIVLGNRPEEPRLGSPRGVGIHVLSALDELSCYTDLDTILRRSVELLRDRFGLQRVGLFLFSSEDHLMHGCWGTGINGQTTDEHRIAFALGDSHREAFRRAEEDEDRFLILPDAPRTVQIDGETRVIGNGWIVLTPIVSVRGRVGLLASDGALSESPVDEVAQSQAAIFCSFLANLIEIKRDDERNDDRTFSAPFLLRHPRALARTDTVTRAVELLRRDPRRTRSELARHLGTTPSQLGRLFKAEMGCSVTEYRNRLRLRRFLGSVDHRGTNLLDAALSAGFGSYAQFHRVFRSLLGATPRDYFSLRSSHAGEARPDDAAPVPRGTEP